MGNRGRSISSSMKYIVYILLILIGISVKSQLPSNTFISRNFTGNTKTQWILSDSPFVNFVGTTTFNARYAGTQFVKIGGGDTAFYFGAGGNLWFRSLSDRDTLSLSNRINLKLNISDTANKWWGLGKRWVDTVYRVNDSTIGFTINNGAQQTFEIKGGASGGGGGSGTVTSVALSMPSAFSVSGSPITSSGTFSVSGAGTSAQYIRGNGTLATFDTTAIPNFYLKARGLLSGTSPITYNTTTGAIGINNASTSGTKGAATFTSAFSDNGLGTIDLANVTSAGTCINCDITFDAKGRAISYASGTPPQFVNAPGAGDTLSISDTLKRLNNGYGILHVVTANNITHSVDTSSANSLVTQYDLSLVNNGLSRNSDTMQLGGNLLKYTLIKVKNNKSDPILNGINALVVSNVSLDSTSEGWLIGNPPSTYSYNRGGIYSDLEFYNDDTLDKDYGGAFNGITRHQFLPSNTRFKNSATPINTGDGGANMVSQLFPPDTAYWFSSPFGSTGGCYSGDIGIGDTNQYRLTIIGHTEYPITVSRMGIDFARKTAAVKREIYGLGVADYVADWRAYQQNINSGTTELGGYINRLNGFMYYGPLYGHTESPSKVKTLAVSTVDTAIAFYTRPVRTETNEVKNGYGFVSDGVQDYNAFKGRTRFGGSMPSSTDTLIFKVHIDSTLQIGSPVVAPSFYRQYVSAHFREYGLTQSTISSKASKVPIYLETEYQSSDPVTFAETFTESVLVGIRFIADSAMTITNNSFGNGVNGMTADMFLRKRSGYLDTTTFVGGRRADSAAAAFQGRIDMSNTQVSGRENIATGYWAAIEPTFQFSPFNKMDHAIWLNVGVGQFNGAAGNVTNGYGLYINTLPTPFITNRYSIYQSGSTDTNYYNGVNRINNLKIAPSTYTVLVHGLTDSVVYQVPASTFSGISTLNTLTAAIQTFATGTAGTDFSISSSSSTHTFNIPSASISNRGLVTTTSQTFGGGKTFNDGAIITFPSGGSGTSLVISGDRSLAAAPGVSGIGMQIASFTYTNSSVAGTEIGAQNFHLVNTPTLTSSNAISYTGDVSTIRFVGAPISAGSTTISHPWTIFANDVNYFQTLAMGVNEQAVDATLGNGSIPIYTGSGGNTFTLPSLATHLGKTYFIKNAGSGNLTVARGGSDNIYDTSSVTSITVAAGGAIIISAGTSFWYVQKTE